MSIGVASAPSQSASCPCGSGKKFGACCGPDELSRPHRDTLALLGLASQAFQGGDFSRAIALTDAIADHALDARVHYLRGRAFRGIQDVNRAEASYRRAIDLDPTYADAHVSLGTTLRAQGRLENAVACYEQAVALDSKAIEAWINLGNVRLDLRRFEEAEQAYRMAVAVKPGNLLARLRHGISLRYTKDLAGAAAAFDGVIASVPDYHEAHIQRGLVHEQEGDLEAAMACYERVLARDAASASALYRKANLLRIAGDVAAAEALLEEAMRAMPADPAANFELGNQLLFQDRYWEAAACYRRVLEFNPNDAIAWSNLGQCHRHMGHLTEGLASFNRAIELQPEFSMPYQGLGSVLVRAGRVAEAVSAFRRATVLDPAFVEAHSSELLSLAYLDSVSPEQLFEAHKKFGDLFAVNEPAVAPEASAARAPRRKRDRDRIRIGYVSPDLRRHAVAFFFEPLLERHDRSRFEVFCYAESAIHDLIAERFQKLADGWRLVAGELPERTGQRVIDDEIDILVDLAGHSGRSPRLFCRRWAQLQLTYLGYPTTTGLGTIDYRLTDWLVDPQGYEAFNVERPLRLPGSYFCYRPPEFSSDATYLRDMDGACVFGSFNNLAKVGDGTLRLWQRVLAAVPGSRLLLKNVGLDDEDLREAFLKRLLGAGMDIDRIELMRWNPSMASHLDVYRTVDVALDTSPYNGATTTCESLWMGVPVVSRSGTTHPARMGLSILTAAGMPELVADTDEGFVDLCVSLAQDLHALRTGREARREQVRSSRLMDEREFVRDFEQAILGIWESDSKGRGQ